MGGWSFLDNYTGVCSFSTSSVSVASAKFLQIPERKNAFFTQEVMRLRMN